jgi:hypothetical protein
LLDRLRCTLKRRPPKYSRWPRLAHAKACTWKRPARTPPSTFLFLPIHFSNSPEPGGPNPVETGQQKSSKPSSFRQPIGSLVTISSEVLRKARHHAGAVRRASGGVYIRGPISCQHDYNEKNRAAPQRPSFSTNGVEPLILQANWLLRRTEATFLGRAGSSGGSVRGPGVPIPDQTRR